MNWNLIVRIIWGLLVFFMIIGGVLGKEMAVAGCVIVAVAWTLNRMIREALEAVDELRNKDNDT